MIRPVNVLLFCSLLGLTAISVAQTDIHLVDSPAKGLFQRSAWAHGYIHGYEAGFHQGNLDLHLGRRVRDPHGVKDYKRADHAYHSNFGNHPDFNKGYGSGFEVGYLDGATGRDFRAATEANRLSDFFEGGSALSPKQATHLDMILDTGYAQGRRMGLNDARSKAEFQEHEPSCPPTADAQEYCSAFQAGFRWGYSDGYSNQRSDANTQRASK